MYKTYESLKATAKVAYDKSYDYLSYYTSWNGKTGEEEDEEDAISNYENVLKIEGYVDEDSNNRILPDVGTYTQYATFFYPPTHIIDNIYLGSAYNAASYNVLKEHNIRVIINVTKEIRNYFPDEFIYSRYQLYDNNRNRILEHLDNAYNDIVRHQKKTEGNILIHCYMGRSRSASMVMYYLMKQKGYTFDDALDYIKTKRPSINPTFRFAKDLAQSMIQ